MERCHSLPGGTFIPGCMGAAARGKSYCTCPINKQRKDRTMSDDKKPEPCPDCKGGESYRDCPACEGTGLASEPAPEVSDGLEWLTEEEVRACLNDADYTGTAGAHHLINYSLTRKYGDLTAQLAEARKDTERLERIRKLKIAGWDLDADAVLLSIAGWNMVAYGHGDTLGDIIDRIDAAKKGQDDD